MSDLESDVFGGTSIEPMSDRESLLADHVDSIPNHPAPRCRIDHEYLPCRVVRALTEGSQDVDAMARARTHGYGGFAAALAATPPAPTPASEDGLRGHVPDALVRALAERHLDDGSPCFCPDYIAGAKSPFSTMDSEHSDYCERVRAALAATTERPAEPEDKP